MQEINDIAVLLSSAFRFAAKKHDEAGQTREDLVTPYWIHPFRVMERLQAVGVNDPEVLAAALLHDVIEDTNTDFSELEKLFGARVARIVADVSQGTQQSLDDYDRQIEKSSADSQTVKLADKWDNVNELHRMQYAAYGNQLPLEYIRNAEDTLAACSQGNSTLQDLLRQEIKKAKQVFAAT